MAIKVVEALKEEVPRRKLTREISIATIIKSLGILLINAMTTRNTHKKMKQRFLGNNMMMRTPY